MDNPVSMADAMQNENQTMKKQSNLFLTFVLVATVFGLASGFGLAYATKGSKAGGSKVAESVTTDAKTGVAAAPAIKVGQVVGSKDASSFQDSAEGVILPGGIGSEGSHHLVRPGGASQSVYLTSSVMDLKLFENAKVKVYGETFKAQKAGWLMDVGRLEVQELNGALPDWVVKEQQKTAAPQAE